MDRNRNDPCLLPRRETCQAEKNYPHRNSFLSKYQLSKILISRQKDRHFLVRPIQDSIVRNTRLFFGDIPDFVAIQTKLIDDLAIYTFIGQEFHLVDSESG